MRKTIFTIVLSIIATLAMAQKTVITGVLVDSTLQEAEPYATVRIFKAGKQKNPVAMGLTDLDGRFRQEVSGSGKHIVQLSSVGKRDVVRQITLGKEQKIDQQAHEKVPPQEVETALLRGNCSIHPAVFAPGDLIILSCLRYHLLSAP